jgi:hypothetical protein
MDKVAIHSCYMTGQQCVYLRSLLSAEASGAFVLCPFTPEFNHLYEMHLSKMKLKEIGLRGRVRRADTVPRTGYVMCSRICYPIQQAGLVIADVTTDNLNVFYELGLAVALDKPLLILAHSERIPRHIRDFLNSSGLSKCTHYYSSVGPPIDDTWTSKYQRASLFGGSRDDDPTRLPSVPVFSNELKPYLQLDGPPLRAREAIVYDIVRSILSKLQKNRFLKGVARRCQVLLHERGDAERGMIISEDQIRKCIANLHDGLYCYHEQILISSFGQALREAEFLLLDTTLRDVETYFWFGVCHGMQREVIPMSLTDQRIPEVQLPFDIRTLWHVYGSLELHSIEEQLTQILTELIAKIISAQSVQNRESFWRPLVRSRTISFYMGTEQASHLASRQVMGEWDVRSFQEMASFASLCNPTLDVRIIKPAFRRDQYRPEHIDAYRDLLRDRIGMSHCIIIGTPDVNPVAEMALCALKGCEPFREHSAVAPLETQSQSPPRPDQFFVEGYVPFKNHLYEYSQPRPTTFFVQFNSRVPERGFLYFAKDLKYVGHLARQYIPRERLIPGDREQREEWGLLTHFVVAPNPFSKDYPNTDHRVILIMGVGGPATFGLAHVLTGTPPECYLYPWQRGMIGEFIGKSEDFLGKINGILHNHRAAEAIVEVTVVNNLASTNNQYEDSRECCRIELAQPISGVENPKPFYFVAPQ